MNLPNEHAGTFRVAILSVVKHDYVPKGILSHERFKAVVVADDANQPEWVHERNRKFADELGVPYVRDVQQAMRDYHPDVAVVSSEAERHVDLSLQAVAAGLHVVQDKPMSTRLSDCDRLVDAVERHGVRFLMWNRNRLPAVTHAKRMIDEGHLGRILAMHVDFYFAKDAGPIKGSRKPEDGPMDWLEMLKAAHATGADGGVGKRPMGELEVEGIYPLAYVQMLASSRVHRVFARTTSHFHQLHADHDVDDLATVSLEMEDGWLATLCLGRIGNASHPEIGEIKLHLVGTQGGLVFSEARPEVGIYYRDQPATEFKHVRVGNDNDWQLADEFARAIDGELEVSLDVLTSREICATVQAAIESGKTGQMVEVAHR